MGSISRLTATGDKPPGSSRIRGARCGSGTCWSRRQRRSPRPHAERPAGARHSPAALLREPSAAVRTEAAWSRLASWLATVSDHQSSRIPRTAGRNAPATTWLVGSSGTPRQPTSRFRGRRGLSLPPEAAQVLRRSDRVKPAERPSMPTTISSNITLVCWLGHNRTPSIPIRSRPRCGLRFLLVVMARRRLLGGWPGAVNITDHECWTFTLSLRRVRAEHGFVRAQPRFALPVPPRLCRS